MNPDLSVNRIWMGLAALALWAGPADLRAAPSPAAGPESPAGVFPNVVVIGHQEIVNSGARTLTELLAVLPGMQTVAGHSQPVPAGSALVSTDAPTQLAASQFSRILVLFQGHPLNKIWHGGADQEWDSGFLEGLKEIRVYTGPSALSPAGGTGAMEMVVDLIPFSGTDQLGSVDVRLSQSLNQDRLDKTVIHLRSGDRWGNDGQYAWFADASGRGGEDIRDPGYLVPTPGRVDRQGLSYQLGATLRKGDLEVVARHLRHDLFDDYSCCARDWTYSFVEGRLSFGLNRNWRLRMTGGADRILSRWGNASTATGEATAAWDRATEFRASLRADLDRAWSKGALRIGFDLMRAWIDAGPDRDGDLASSMVFSTRRNRGGADLLLHLQLSPRLSLQAATRVEQTTGCGRLVLLPEAAFDYRRGNTACGVRLALGQRPLDVWYRNGSGYRDAGGEITPYVIPASLSPERHRQIRAWVDRRLGGPWSLSFSAFMGAYRRLTGFDWEFALAHNLLQVRAMSAGGFDYAGAVGALSYRTRRLRLQADASWQATHDAGLEPRQLYLDDDGQRPLFRSPLAVNLDLEWLPSRRLSLNARLRIAGEAGNGGIDLVDPDHPARYGTAPFADTPARAVLDLAFRLPEFWKRIDAQLTVRNALSAHPLQPFVEGGTLRPRGAEYTLVLRRRF